MLVFPDQKLTAEQHLSFAAHFGPHETSIAVYRPDAHKGLRVQKEIADVSNLDPEGQIWGRDSRTRMFQMANRIWHTDSSFKRVPASYNFV